MPQGTGYVACGACAGEGSTHPAGAAAAAAGSQAGASGQNGGSRTPLISQGGSRPALAAAARGERCGSCSGVQLLAVHSRHLGILAVKAAI